MTLNVKIRGFNGFLAISGCETFQERIAPKSIEIDIDKLRTGFSFPGTRFLRMKFLALNVNFDGLSLDFLRSRKPAHKGIKERYPRKSRYFTIVGQSFVKTAGDRLTVC